MTIAVMAREGMAPDVRDFLAHPLSEAELSQCATKCATQQIKLTGKTHPVNATHELLLEYARTRATTAPSGTINQFTYWWESVTGYRIPERTFRRHTSVLRKMGLVNVRYDRDEFYVKRTWYDLIGLRLIMPSVTVSHDGVIGFESPRNRVTEEHQKAMATLSDFDLDQLQAEWCGESCCVDCEAIAHYNPIPYNPDVPPYY